TIKCYHRSSYTTLPVSLQTLRRNLLSQSATKQPESGLLFSVSKAVKIPRQLVVKVAKKI
ncbi:MAG: hypothetical protein ACI9HK_005351, partial [Pirellulaceae bacterium]